MNARQLSKQSDNYWEAHARILESIPRFQAAVAIVRKKLKIPATGIPHDKRSEWYKKQFLNSDINTGSRYGYAYGYELLPPNKRFLNALDKLRADFNLDPRWLFPLFRYIYSVDEPLSTPSSQRAWPAPRFNDVRLPKKQLRVTSLSIQLEKDTAINDIRAIWDVIQGYQAYMDSDLPSRRDPIKTKTVEKYKTVQKLKCKGLNYTQIAEQHEELGFNVAEDVTGFIKRVEKRFKRRKGITLRAVPDLWRQEE